MSQLPFIALLTTIAMIVGPSRGAAQAIPEGYTIVGRPENVPSSSAPRRFTVRIRVQFGKSRSEITTLLERVARQQQRDLRANAVTIFAYRPGDPTDGQYSVGRAMIAPYGDWSRAGENGPLRVQIDLENAYFSGDPARQNGTTKRFSSDGASRTVFVSRRFESWGDADIIARVSTGIDVLVLETRTSGPYLTRLKVRFRLRGKSIEGWVDDTDVR
jgi:hypothetical protein